MVYDLLNRISLDARLEPSPVGEVTLARQQLEHLHPGDVQINDRGFTGYLYLASVSLRDRHFIGRCSTGSFLAAQEMFRRNQANQSQGVWLFAPPDQKAECQRLGLPLKLKTRCPVSAKVRLAPQAVESLGVAVGVSPSAVASSAASRDA